MVSLEFTNNSPHQILFIDGRWIIYGTIKNKNKKGGVFMIVINSRNSAIEYLSHSK